MPQHEDRERFIPFRKAEIIEMLCEDGILSKEDQQRFRNFFKILESLYHFEFHDKVEFLKNNYYPFNPDKDTKTIRQYSPEKLKECEKNLVSKFQEVLNDANYEEIKQSDLKMAMEEESLFHIDLDVDFNEFASYMICRRGEVVNKATISKFYFKKREIDVPTYERVAMLIRFKDKEYFEQKKRKNMTFDPGTMVIKLFKNIPKADLEMLFPNTQVKMSLMDKLLMGIPGGGGFLWLLMAKGALLVAALGALIPVVKVFVSGGSASDINANDMAALIGGGAAIGALLGYMYKQWTAYNNRKIQYMKTLGDSLYFKNLDNNAGVFNHIIDAAEEEECKEAILGYYFLLLNPNGLSEEALDKTIEKWFEEKHKTLIDFEVDDSLRKLKHLQLCTAEERPGQEPIYKALTLDAGCERLDYIWDNFFQYNNK